MVPIIQSLMEIPWSNAAGEMVRAVGIEPTLCFQNQILSLARLPVPPRPRRVSPGATRRNIGEPDRASIADFKLCIARGRAGAHADLQAGGDVDNTLKNDESKAISGNKPMPSAMSTERKGAGVALVLGLAAILGALAFQFIGGLFPCELCYTQRWPYYIGLPLIGIALLVWDRLPLPIRIGLLGIAAA